MARKNCKDCIWAEDCGKCKPCEDFSPVDDTKDREEYYEQTLRERHEDYMEVVEEYK